MARRTRKERVVWLPADINNRLGLGGAPAIDGLQSAVLQGIVSTPPGSVIGFATTELFPIVKDNPQNIAAATQTLSDLEGSAYRLRRIVGKIFISTPQGDNIVAAGSPTAFLVVAGFIILDVLPDGTPKSALTTDYNVQALDNIRDPWIWRRSWIVQNVVGNNAAGAGALPFEDLFPPTNLAYSGVLDGPHVDAKTARNVSDEQRLFLAMTVVALNGDAGGVTQNDVSFLADLRVLASMRRQSGNRGNASR